MTRRPTEKELLEGLNEDSAHADELTEPLPQEVEPRAPRERLKGAALHYDDPTARSASWDEWFDQAGVSKNYFEKLGRTGRYYRVPAELFDAMLERLDDQYLVAIVKERSSEESVRVDLGEV